MKLIKLELLEDYKLLKKGSIYEFSDSNMIALIGVNGSGKTQVLELINRILSSIENINFSFSNLLNSVYLENIRDIGAELTFKLAEIEYKLKVTNLGIEATILGSILTNMSVNILKQIKEKLNIITYSLGRSKLSAPYYYNNLKIFRDYKHSLRGLYFENDLKTSSNTKFLNEKLRKILILVLFIFYEEKINELFPNLFSIKKLKSFSIDITSKFNDKIEFVPKISPNVWAYQIVPLFHNVQTYYKNSSEEEIYNSIFQDDSNDRFIANNSLAASYYSKNHYIHNCFFNNESINSIKEKYLAPLALFNSLELLENTNLLKFSDAKINRLLSTDIANLSEQLEDNYESKYFYIEKIIFENGVSYNDLAEGEKQLLETLGIVLLFQSRDDGKSNLFIFDEPDTNLNISWKNKYITLIEKVLNGGECNSQLLFSSHSAEIISDLKSEEIYLMENGKFKGVRNYFGETINRINTELFGRKNTISEKAYSKIQDYYLKIKIENSKENLGEIEKEVRDNLGDSVERFLLLKEISRKINEVK